MQHYDGWLLHSECAVYSCRRSDFLGLHQAGRLEAAIFAIKSMAPTGDWIKLRTLHIE